MCLNPRTIRIDRGFGIESIQVPCGKCLECLVHYQNGWTVRMVEELRKYGKGCFITLTYRNSAIPKIIDTETGEVNYSVSKVHLQKWLKRFRVNYERTYGYRPDFKYFATSEYGPRTCRPHYHLLVFGLCRCDLLAALSDWSRHYGFTKCRNVIPSARYRGKDFLHTAAYVAKYCSKGVFECPKVTAGKVDKTFHLISKGVGLSYVERMKSYHLGTELFRKRLLSIQPFKYSDVYLDYVSSHMRVLLDPEQTRSYSMPKYYKEKIYGSKVSLQAQIADFLRKRNEILYNKSLERLSALHPDWSEGEVVTGLAMESEAELRERGDVAFRKLKRFYSKSLY